MNENIMQNEEIEIDLLELFHMLLRKWWLILTGALAGAMAMFVITAWILTPMYESSAMLYILNKTTSVTSLADIQIGTALSEDFKVIATSKPVIDTAIETIKKTEGSNFTRKEIIDALTITNMEDTRILHISVESDNPEYACVIANAVADATAKQMAEIMKSDAPTIVERAEVSEEPVSPSMLKNVILGFVGAGFVVCAVLVVLFLLNDNIKTEEDVEKYLGVPTLATIPYISGKDRKKEELAKQKKESYAKK